ncbi:MAG: GNAT family N-acetyltransferase [Erythrobacter sp.]
MTAPALAITIRPEAPGDEEAIRDLTSAAFEGVQHSDGSEPAIVDRLRRDGDLALSLVAQDETGIVGHIAFSRVTISDGAQRWYGLAPVSVWPELHHRGVGGTLVRRGIADLAERGARGIVLLGEPDYYARFGFRHEPQLVYPGPPPEYFQCLLLEGDLPRGEVSYAPAFG